MKFSKSKMQTFGFGFYVAINPGFGPTVNDPAAIDPRRYTFALVLAYWCFRLDIK